MLTARRCALPHYTTVPIWYVPAKPHQPSSDDHPSSSAFLTFPTTTRPNNSSRHLQPPREKYSRSTRTAIETRSNPQTAAMATPAAAAAARPPFTFPREYFFPAFFTRQTNLTTLHAQLVKWSTLVLSYCRHHRIFKLSLSQTSPTTTNPSASATAARPADAGPDTEELFHNRRLNRRLAPADVREVVEFMRKDGRAEWVGGDGGGSGSSGAGGVGDMVWVYWRTPEEWAGLIEAWVDETAQKGTVLTLYELTEGEATRGTGWSTFLFFFLLMLSLFFWLLVCTRCDLCIVK